MAEVERGRRSYAEGAWRRAHESLSSADGASPLGAEDLELLARSAYMLGRDDEYVAALERAHDAHLGAGDPLRAVRCAFWIGHSMLFRGQTPRATGWFGRAQRLLEREREDCVERGYLLIPLWLQQMGSGDFETGYATQPTPPRSASASAMRTRLAGKGRARSPYLRREARGGSTGD